MLCQKDLYTLIEQSFNSRITCMQYSQKNFMRIIGNDQKNNGQNFWEILERIIGKISSIIGAGLIILYFSCLLGLNYHSQDFITIHFNIFYLKHGFTGIEIIAINDLYLFY